jgi:hypothetical protein
LPANLTGTTRRSCLSLLAGAASVATASLARAAEAVDVHDPARRLETYIRIRARIDGQKTFMPYRGTVFGKPDGKIATPLFDVEGFSWTKASRLGPDSLRLDMAEAGYFLDRSNGRPLHEWTNPLNGVQTVVEHYRSWSHIVATPDALRPILPQPAGPGMLIQASAGPPSVMGDTVWIHEDLLVQIPNRPKERFADPRDYSGPTVTATSLATWSADIADCVDPAKPYTPSLFSYQTLGSWRPFMKMGEAPGLVSWRMFGRKAASIEQIAGPLRDRVLADHPDFLSRETEHP